MATVTELPTPEGRGPDKFAAYLRDTVFAFELADEHKYFADLQKQTTEFCQSLLKVTITAAEIQATIGGLLAQGLRDKHRRDAPRAVQQGRGRARSRSRPCSTWSMVDSWNWPAEGVRVDLHRQIDGEFRAYMEEGYGSTFFT
ncbi:hypothetical protein BC828DRAFT_398478 [Blastocladiella britannica]|nr:hypothetical protein BC828DRAFT_398478 [Blastocladiella britannica]